MGKILSVALRPIKNFNVENRAHRVISKDKPEPAPRHPSNLEDIQRALEADPGLIEKLSSKNESLDKRLRDVFVTSEGPLEDKLTQQRYNPKRPLPQDRSFPEDYEYGIKEPETIPYGRTSLRKVLKFLTDHQTNPNENPASKIAFEQKLKEEDVIEILKHFKTFEVYIPATAKTKARFAGPSQVRKLVEMEKKQIEDKESQKMDQKT